MKSIIHAVIIAAVLLIFTPLLQAAETTGGSMADMAKSGSSMADMAKTDSSMADMAKDQQKDMFLKKKTIDEYTVSFSVTKVAPGMEHGGSHNLMVKAEKDGKAQVLRKIFAKVILADGTAKKQSLFKMGDWYMNGFDLGSPGKHQLIILFKTADGVKHNGGVYYEAPGDK